jgi:hypothetical protein
MPLAVVAGGLFLAVLSTAAAGRRLSAAQGVEFVDWLHGAIWVSGLAPFVAALLTALVLFRNRPRHRRRLATQTTNSTRGEFQSVNSPSNKQQSDVHTLH